MTTVAANRYEMAADSLAVANNRKYRTRKLYRAAGAVVGVSGGIGEMLMAVRWYEAGADLAARPDGLNGTMLVLDESGLYRYEGNCYPIPVLDDFAATGSGSDIALAAMLMGKTPAEAVALACEVDLHTGPPVVAETL